VTGGQPAQRPAPEDVGLTGETLRPTVSDVMPHRVTRQLDQVVNPEAQAPPPAADRPRVTVQDPPRTVPVGD
jgi:hypothetical protein